MFFVPSTNASPVLAIFSISLPLSSQIEPVKETSGFPAVSVVSPEHNENEQPVKHDCALMTFNNVNNRNAGRKVEGMFILDG